MGKKGSWFSAIKRVFAHNSKEKPGDGSDKTSSREKKRGKRILKHSETKSFIPLFREPSSIEKILGEADQLLIRQPKPSEQQKSLSSLHGKPFSPKVVSPRTSFRRASSPKVSSPQVLSPKVSSPKVVSPKIAPFKASAPKASSSKAPSHQVTQSHKESENIQRPELTLRNQQLSATKIQAAYRGYLARRSFRALKGLVRLQGVLRSQNVKRQTMNAMKQMQLLVRVQTQIHSRRIQMLENQAFQTDAYKNDKDAESTTSKWTLNQISNTGSHENWDDSILTKDEVDSRLQKKVEAVMKRERAMAYAYSNQPWKANPRPTQSPVDIRSNGFPWWWNWLERQMPPSSASQSQATPKNFSVTPSRSVSDYKPNSRYPASNFKQNNFTFDYQETPTPRSSRSAVPARAKQFQTPGGTPPSVNSIKYSKPRASAASSAYDIPLKDDDSLMSCPPFSVPSYMAPTVSAQAKVRANSNPRERQSPGTPGSDSKRRFSFPLTPSIGPVKWNKGSGKDAASQRVQENHKFSLSNADTISVDSTLSMPATVGRKPFNRFV